MQLFFFVSDYTFFVLFGILAVYSFQIYLACSTVFSLKTAEAVLNLTWKFQ